MGALNGNTHGGASTGPLVNMKLMLAMSMPSSSAASRDFTMAIPVVAV